MNSKFIGQMRYIFLNKGKHRQKRKQQRQEIPFMGPAQWLLLTSNHKWRDLYGRRT